MSTMAREFIISLYLLMYKLLFNFFKLFPIKNKIVFVASFKDNNLYIYRKLNDKQFPGEVVFLCKESCFHSIKEKTSVPVYVIESGNFVHELKAAYHLMTAKTIIVDNYYGFLSVAKFKKGVECIQIWHAAGAIKNFGLLDPTVEQRPKRAQKRIKKVYQNFHKVVVGSDVFADIFKKAFNVKEEQLLRFGYPRTDFFYNQTAQEKKREQFYQKYPQFKNKKIILYAPTYRPNPEDNQLKLDIDQLYKSLKDEYVLFIRLHPSVSISEINYFVYQDFVFDFSNKASINDLIVVSDLLITDYSSIPFEYAILEKPMIFYPYDLEKYQENPGIWAKYEDIVPGPVAFLTKDILRYIKSNDFDYEKYRAFKEKWNKYSKGFSSENMVHYLLKRHNME
ncbi:CDP-glycerol glycerophosphotransferase family protein [Caldibacillus thermolactis]|jgi:teichoic acid glycerol-phosphate primase|uniref:CDP-glycerol glycerophosphotransferase family protein n=1 Tax=Pallidibacillus thermolactis TaxID=251051 RepID=A0ABT2WIJ1_9BACI|nr:CDP-glycerol glycerophosphotransferase family protein [Pallidibacillus thermolactis]MCU9595507.1 CDP-glycerol glycerophosphotransferase family protein [Pallidibacillus thermolactis]MCU9599725.1 CDP-glycerol glycerophosphotransferase family protein [Pallidibacillus thermolactis subsp. kokeshiiformis]